MTIPVQTPLEFLQISAGVSGATTADQILYQTSMAAPSILNLDGNGLKLEWDILRTRSSKTDEAEITVYNLSQAFRLQWYAVYRAFEPVGGMKVGIHIGWGGTVNLVMYGSAWEMIPERKTGTDVLTTVRIGDGQAAVKLGPAVLLPTQTVGQPNILFDLLKVEFGKIPLILDEDQRPMWQEATARTILPSPFSYTTSGELIDNLTDLIATMGLEWKLINGRVVFMDRGITASSQNPLATVLTASTGLLEWEETDGGGVRCQALAQPSVLPGTQITVLSELGVPVGAPFYRVESARFTGSTDGPSLMVVEGRRGVPV
jgi:hypothetical protein